MAKVTFSDLKNQGATIVNSAATQTIKMAAGGALNMLAFDAMTPVYMTVHGTACLFPSALHAFFAHRIAANCPNLAKFLGMMQSSVSDYQGLFFGCSAGFIAPKGVKQSDLPYHRDDEKTKDIKAEFKQNAAWGDTEFMWETLKAVVLAKFTTNPILLPMLWATEKKTLVSVRYSDNYLHTDKALEEGGKIAYAGENRYGQALEWVRKEALFGATVPVTGTNFKFVWTLEPGLKKVEEKAAKKAEAQKEKTPVAAPTKEKELERTGSWPYAKVKEETKPAVTAAPSTKVKVPSSGKIKVRTVK